MAGAEDRRHHSRGSRPFLSDRRAPLRPNRDLCALLEKGHRKALLISCSVESTHTSSLPQSETAPSGDQDFVFGFVGRLSIEENVALLVQIQQQLREGHP